MTWDKIKKDVEKIDKEFHYFNKIDIQGSNNGKLKGYAISVKDNICVKGMETTAGSKILKGYRPIFDATVIEKIRKAGGTIIGKTTQDEFGYGSFCTNTEKIPLNPIDKTRVCGGSSGGAAGITKKANFKHIALAESTGGSIVNPAAFCGVIGICPTYGRVSRYGLIDYANSLDKIGAMAKNMKEIALIMKIISGYDEKDSTSAKVDIDNYSEYLDKPIKKMKIGIIKETLEKGTDKGVSDNFWKSIKKLESEGIDYEEIKMPLTMKYGLSTYYLIAMAETSTNLAKYCGMRYGAEERLEGSFNEYFSKVRSKYLGEEAKRRVMLGTFARMAGYRDAYYVKALQLRQKIIDEYKLLYKKFDLLASPTMPIIAPKFSDIEKLTPLQNYQMDTLTVGPNLAGMPHITIPSGEINNMPTGIMLIGNHFEEGRLMQVGNKL